MVQAELAEGRMVGVLRRGQSLGEGRGYARGRLMISGNMDPRLAISKHVLVITRSGKESGDTGDPPIAEESGTVPPAPVGEQMAPTPSTRVSRSTKGRAQAAQRGTPAMPAAVTTAPAAAAAAAVPAAAAAVPAPTKFSFKPVTPVAPPPEHDEGSVSMGEDPIPRQTRSQARRSRSAGAPVTRPWTPISNGVEEASSSAPTAAVAAESTASVGDTPPVPSRSGQGPGSVKRPLQEPPVPTPKGIPREDRGIPRGFRFKPSGGPKLRPGEGRTGFPAMSSPGEPSSREGQTGFPGMTHPTPGLQFGAGECPIPGGGVQSGAGEREYE